MSADGKSSLHYRYCILILILCCIAIATDRWTGQEGFTDYLSNAATITSLLLGLIAIIYSFFSNGAISSNLGGISSASKDVEKVGKQIEEYLSVAKNIEVLGKDNLSSLAEFSSSMGEGLKEFSNLLRTMDEKNSSMHGLLINIPEQLDSLEKKFFTGSPSSKERTEGSENVAGNESLLGEEVIQRFFERSSVSEITVAYCCVKSNQGAKVLDFGFISEVAVGLSKDQVISIVRCMDSLDLIEVYSDDNSSDDSYTIGRVNPHLFNKIEEVLISEILTAYPNKGASYERWMKRVEKINSNYSVN